MRKLKFIIPVLLLGILILIGAGCGVTTPPAEESVIPGGEGGEEVPTSDVAGEDFSDVPRYSGSVRIHYGPVPGVPNSTVVVYLTSASINTVSDFYEEQLPANGWTSPMDEATMQMFGLTYRYVEQAVEKVGKQVVVTVSSSFDYPGYTEANITLSLE